MSRSFFYWTNRIANIIGIGPGNRNGNIIIQLPICAIMCGGHAAYSYGTQKQKIVKIEILLGE